MTILSRLKRFYLKFQIQLLEASIYLASHRNDDSAIERYNELIFERNQKLYQLELFSSNTGKESQG
jgi:hypothetical protein